MKGGNLQRGIHLLLAGMLLALGLYPVGAVWAQGRRFLSAGERAAQAETAGSMRYVKPNGSTTGGCQSWDTACDLQRALAAAISGDELWVAEGTYTPGVPGNRQATFQLKEGVEIYGGFAGDESALGQRSWTAHPSILSGDIDQNDVTESGVVTNTLQIKGENAYHVVSASDITSAAVLDGFTITAGNANPAIVSEQVGGGMYADNSKITLRNVNFSGNSAKYDGGGMYNENGNNPSLTHVTFSGNSATDAGGGMCNAGSSPTLTDVTFTGNSATNAGGGMFNVTSNPNLTNVNFSGNSAGNGGGMNNQGSSPILTGITFSANSADYGGGMSNDGSSPTLRRVTFTGNLATHFGGGMYNLYSSSPALTDVTLFGNSANLGGGMYNYESSPNLTNVTLSGNTAGAGGGIFNDGTSSPSLTNTILWGNTPDQIYNVSGSTPAITYSDIQGGDSGTGNINGDPLFVDAAGGDLHLQSTSPAIDAGDNTAAGLAGINTDLDDNPRFVDFMGSGGAPIVDMGAYEAQITAPTITTQPQSQIIASGQTATLTVVASGSSLSYQWYQGTNGDTSNPVGTDSDTFTTPALTSDTSYWVRVSNSAGSVDSDTASITINQPPTISSPNSTTFTEGVAGSFTVTTAAGVPPATTISESGALPGGVSFTDNGDGSATLSGTPASGTSGTYHLSITASNGTAPDATQDFTLNVLIAPVGNTHTFLPLLARH